MSKTEMWLLYFCLMVLGTRPWRSGVEQVEQKHALLERELCKALGVRWPLRGMLIAQALEPVLDYFIAALEHEPKPPLERS